MGRVHHDQLKRSNVTEIPFVTLLLHLSPALLVILILFGGGLLLGLLQALGHLPSSTITDLNLDHFIKVIGDPDFLQSLLLTIYISGISTFVAAAISIGLALALLNWAPHNRFVHFILQVPLTAPHLVVAISVVLLLSPTGFFSRLLSSVDLIASPSQFPLLVNDAGALGILLVYIWKEIPFITFMILAVLKNSGPELLEAGATLKANKLQRFFYITLPIIGPNLAAASLIVFAFTFGAFEVPYLLGQTYPVTLPVWAYKAYSDVDLIARPEGIAIGIIIAVLIILVVIVSQVISQRSYYGKAT